MQNVLPSDLDALIITNPYNILYLTGFKGISDTEREAILIVRGHKGKVAYVLITAVLYQSEASKLKAENLKVVFTSERDTLLLAILKTLLGAQKIGYEEKNLRVSELNNFKALLPGKDLVGTANLVEDLRMIKTDKEIKKIEKAQIIAQRALDLLLPTIKLGQTEQELAHNLLSIIYHLNGDGFSFEPIIASGPNAGIPHHKTSSRKIKYGDTLLFDFGTKVMNYCSDLSRTVFIGKASDRQLNIYNHVSSAQKAAIGNIEKELKLFDAYNFVREIFKTAKLHNYFTHGLGHGVGLEIHEPPYFRPAARDEDLILENSVFSVEPGLYFPWGGVRIEDLIVIKDGKPKVLGTMQRGAISIKNN